MTLSTHVLDTARGCPAANLHLTLAREAGPAWTPVTESTTNPEGRVPALLDSGNADPGPLPATYRLRFHTAPYYAAFGLATLYPYIDIVFHIADPSQHYHIPLLLTPHGYTTYRGS